MRNHTKRRSSPPGLGRSRRDLRFPLLCRPAATATAGGETGVYYREQNPARLVGLNGNTVR